MIGTVDSQDGQKILENKCHSLGRYPSSPDSLQRHPFRYLPQVPQTIVLLNLRDFLDMSDTVDNQEHQETFLNKCGSLVQDRIDTSDIWVTLTLVGIHHDNQNNQAPLVVVNLLR